MKSCYLRAEYFKCSGIYQNLNLNFKVVFFLVSYTFTVLWSVIIIWGSADWIIRILVLKLQSESLDNNIITSTCLASGQWGYIFRTGKIILTHDTFLVFVQSVLLLCPCVIQSKNYIIDILYFAIANLRLLVGLKLLLGPLQETL